MPTPKEDVALSHHRRDVRTAAVVHVLLIVALIVLWVVNTRLRFLTRLEDVLLKALFGEG